LLGLGAAEWNVDGVRTPVVLTHTHLNQNTSPKTNTLTCAHVVLLLARAGSGQQQPQARITPLKDLAGLPTLEFLVHKRSLQTGGADYPREVDALAALLKEGLPADSPLLLPQQQQHGRGGPLALPPLEEFLFDDVAHMVP
jgi:hypothetical protein